MSNRVFDFNFTDLITENGIKLAGSLKAKLITGSAAFFRFAHGKLRDQFLKKRNVSGLLKES
jgi:hypothetical protein